MAGNEELDAAFIKEAQAKGMCNLKGHPAAGGIRASIYNSMPREGVEVLIVAMKAFETRNS